MKTHRVLSERLEALLGPPHRKAEIHTWHVPVGKHQVDITLDLPHPATKIRVWIFDPRNDGADCARHFTVEDPAELEEVVGAIAAVAREMQASGPPTSAR